MWWRRLPEDQTEHQNGEERGFKLLWTWNGCWCKTAALSSSKTADLLEFTHKTISRVYREWSEKERNIPWAAVVWTKMPCWCQRRMGRLVRDDRKTTVTQITTRYNQGVQNTISEHTTRWTLKQMGYSSRRLHWCYGVWIFSWHTLGPLVPIDHRFNTTAYLSVVADHVHPFMTSVPIF